MVGHSGVNSPLPLHVPRGHSISQIVDEKVCFFKVHNVYSFYLILGNSKAPYFVSLNWTKYAFEYGKYLISGK